MARRCRLEIIIDILGVISSGATKTKIVYEANLNFNIATKYLDLLQEKKFIRKNSDVYEMTEDGQMFLDKAKELQIQISGSSSNFFPCPVILILLLAESNSMNSNSDRKSRTFISFSCARSVCRAISSTVAQLPDRV